MDDTEKSERIDTPETPQCCQDMAGRIEALEKRVDALEQSRGLIGMDIWAGD